MVTFVAILLTTYLGSVADTTLAPAISIYGITPCLLPLVAVAWASAAAPSPWRAGQLALCGLAFDLNSGGHVGIGMLTFALMALAIAQARGELRRLEPLEQAIASAPALVLMQFAIAVGNRLTGEGAGSFAATLLNSAAAGTYTAALGLPVWLILAWLRQTHRLRPAALRY